jgi:hypothetical protein
MKKAKPDGRKIAANMLIEMQEINERPTEQNLESRRVLMGGLLEMQDLPVHEKNRFVAALNEYIGSAMQGGVMDAEIFLKLDARNLEGVSARLNSKYRADFSDGLGAYA